MVNRAGDSNLQPVDFSRCVAVLCFQAFSCVLPHGLACYLGGTQAGLRFVDCTPVMRQFSMGTLARLAQFGMAQGSTEGEQRPALQHPAVDQGRTVSGDRPLWLLPDLTRFSIIVLTVGHQTASHIWVASNAQEYFCLPSREPFVGSSGPPNIGNITPAPTAS